MKKFFLALALVAVMGSSAWAQTASLTLSWQDSSSNEDGFGIERKLGTSGTFAEIIRLGVNVVTYGETTLAFSTQYCYRLYAYNVAGKSGYSNEACGTTKANPLPAAPTGLTVTPLP